MENWEKEKVLESESEISEKKEEREAKKKTGLQPVTRPVEQVHYLRGWG